MSKESLADTAPAPVRALLSGLIDYAGLFPPAQLGMVQAVENYAEYLRGPHCWMLGRFVVPVAKLGEFDQAAAPVLPKGEGTTPWRVAALVGNDLQTDVQEALKFNCRHWPRSEIGHAVIDTLEARTSDLVSHATRSTVPDFFALYVESGGGTLSESAMDAIASIGARAKIRMGGVTAEAFPAAENVAAFLGACAERRLAFKATAGLHHAVRGEYPLTYEPDAKCAPMYGFLNVFIAAAVAFSGGSPADSRDILLRADLSDFKSDDGGISWSGSRLSTEDLTRARRFAASYGSCSFVEPVAELREAGLI